MKKILSLFALLALTCSMYATEVTVTKTIATAAAENNWVTSKYCSPFYIGNAITISGHGKYNSTGGYWRLYDKQDNGYIKIQGATGVTIKSVAIAYSSANSGTLSLEKGWEQSGDILIISGTTYEVNANSVTYYASSKVAKSDTKDATSSVTSITITYDDPNVICETFSQVVQTGSAGANTKWQGDLAEWTVYKARRKDTDKMIDGTRATWTSSGAYMKATVEGGIKHLCFNWSQISDATSDSIIKMRVQVGSVDTTMQYKTVKNAGVMQTFDKEIACKENQLLTLSNATVFSANPDRVEFGNIIITPYLWFTVPNHEASITLTPSASSYDLGAVLINNTTVDPTYTIESNNTGSACSITNDVMDLSDVKQSGDIQIKASWNDGKVYTTMTLHVTSTQVTLADAEVALDSSYAPVPVVKLGETVIENASITYASSNTNVAKVSNDGKTIILFGTGTTTITTTVAQGDTYLGATTTSTLTVNTFTPEQGTYWEETFAALPEADGYTSEESGFDGDSLIYPTWLIKQYKMTTSDKATGYFRLNQKNSPYLKSSEAMEGGIKYVLFNWHLAGDQTNPVKIVFGAMALDGSTELARYKVDTAVQYKSEIYPVAVRFDIAQNISYKLATLSGIKSIPMFGPIKVVPYLLYTAPKHETTINIGENTSYDLSTELINNTGETPDYEIVSNTTGSACAISGNVLDLSDATSNGDIQVKAKWNEGKVYTTLTIHVKTAKITVEDAEVSINGTYTPTVVVKKAGAVVTDPEVTYTSSNASVATVNADGKTFKLLGSGTTTITASLASGEQSTSTLTVTAVAPADGTFWKETFKNMAMGTSYNTANVNIIGDSSIYVWNCREFQHHADNDKVGNELGVRIRPVNNHDNYIEMDGNQEGGIKEVYVKWRLPGSGSPDVLFNVEAYRDENLLVERTIDMKDVQAGSENVIECQQKMDIKQNAKLKIYTKTGSSAVVFGPISVTPYLLYKKKFMEKKLSECEGQKFQNSTLINNTSGCGGTIYYKSSDESVATIDNSGNVEVHKASADTITITAIWKTSETDSVTTSYRLKINDREKRQVAFAKSSINLKVGETPVNSIEGTVFQTDVVTYSSADEHVAKVANNVVTVVGIGETTITADIAQSAIYLAGKVSYKLTVTPKEAAENILVETFTGVDTDTTAWSGDLKKYGITWTRSDFVQRRTGDKIAGKQGTWMMQSKYITSDGTIEGGVKHFYARWIQPSKEPGATLRVGLYLDNESEAAPATGDSFYNEGGTPLNDSIFTYAANPNCDRNVKLTFKNISSVAAGREEEGRIIFDQFNIVPYLFYTKKADTIHVADYPSGTTYENTALIDNTDDSDNIQYSILGENTSSIATIDQTTGEIAVVGKGEVTVQAKWHNVTTTYLLTIEKNTKVFLMRNDGTEDKDTIVMEYNATFPSTFAYPTRDNYMFNAYFENADGGQRYTVTVKGGVTKWVNYAGYISDRKWIYEGKEKTMYALWKPVVTIALDNQDATTAGTEEVKTANCPKNENIYLTSIDELPTKTGYVFGGYYTEAQGKGSQIIDATGAFIANVDGYTNAKTMWQKDDAITTLYAKWTEHTTVVLLERNDDTGVVDTITATYSKTMPSYSMPSRENYKPNAFFTNTGFDNADRLTVTNGNGTTKWVAKRPGYVDNDRKWINTDDTVRLYLQWGKKCTITLDNQSATTAGTETIITYNCPNNEKDTWLPTSITKPAKDDATFMGYYTSENGQGVQIIDAEGNCLKSVDGYTDANKCWIYGDDATLYAHWKSVTVEITLNENNEKNDSIIAANEGNTIKVITDRKITGGMFNTICLPFDVEAEQMAEVFGADYQLVEFSSATLNESKNELNLRFNTVNKLEAGVPYLIKISETKKDITFSNVTIVNTLGESVGEGIKMYGIMSPTVLGADDKTHLIVVANDKLSWVAKNDTESLKGMRAYLMVVDPQMQAAIRKSNPRLVLNGTDTTTELMQNAQCTMQGARKLLINGQLYIENNGRLYNVLGY